MKRISLALLTALLVPSSFLRGQEGETVPELNGIKFERRLGEQLPLDARFRDDRGREVRLEKYFGEKPVLLVLAYYRCPRLCSVVLKGMVDSVRKLSLVPGKDFQIVVVSVDHREGPALSSAKKQSALEAYGREGTDEGWHFLTGEEKEIRKLSDSVGFYFVWDQSSDEIRHPSGIMLITPQGKISKYFYGVDYPNLRLGLVDASENRISAPVDRVLLFTCFAYDEESGKYLVSPMKLMRLGAMLTVIVLGGYLGWNWLRRPTHPLPVPTPSTAAANGSEQGAR